MRAARAGQALEWLEARRQEASAKMLSVVKPRRALRAAARAAARAGARARAGRARRG